MNALAAFAVTVLAVVAVGHVALAVVAYLATRGDR
jgi:hypothetical protein